MNVGIARHSLRSNVKGDRIGLFVRVVAAALHPVLRAAPSLVSSGHGLTIPQGPANEVG